MRRIPEAAIPLVAGQQYYLEALMKEQTGGDNLAVAWQKPVSISAKGESFLGGMLMD